jgi:hypothetical protein
MRRVDDAGPLRLFPSQDLERILPLVAEPLLEQRLDRSFRQE